LIQRAYSNPVGVTPEEVKRFQQDLFDIQKRNEAWGLVIPLLNHPDQNVQFFGAHTAQVKIARDWDAFPHEHYESLRDLMVQLTAHSVMQGLPKFILRKLFVAISSLALKLAPGHPSRWPSWILSCVSTFNEKGVSADHIHDFLAIVAEEVAHADLLGISKVQMHQSLIDAAPMVVQAITSTISQPIGTLPTSHFTAALKNLQAWLVNMTGSELTPLIPLLISLLDPSFSDDSIFIAASDALQEITAKSPLSDGAGTKTLTEPLMIWLDVVGNEIMQHALKTEDYSPIFHSLCKLVVALGDHSTSYIALNIASDKTVVGGTSNGINGAAAANVTTKGHLVQNFLRLLLQYTGLPGYFGVDEEESEMTLAFWYLLQEALWSTDWYDEEEEGYEDITTGTAAHPVNGGVDQADREKSFIMAKAVYTELVVVLRRKVAFPPVGSGWSRDQVEKFQVYRRDVGDILVNAYYVLRGDMLEYFIKDIADRLATRQESDGWQEIEATLHCIMSIQEAVDMEKANLSRLFSPEILGRLPFTGRSRVRRTALGLIGAYSSWFSSQPHPPVGSTQPNLLLTVLSYVVSALPDPALSLPSAIALRNLCEANRTELALHIAAFGELHAGLGSVPDTEKSKVLQSISSVIQAMPVEQEIPAIEAVINPIVQKLYEALQNSTTLPDEARASTIMHLETLSGVAKGLTRTVEGMTVLEDDTDPAVQAEIEKINIARADPRAVKLRDAIFSVVRGIAEIWGVDTGVSMALSDLFKSITSLPSDITIISLPAGPLLELVCLSAQRQLTAAWISLAGILIGQLNPPPMGLNLNMKSGPTPEAENTVRATLPVLLRCSLEVLGGEGGMDENPDIVQSFFVCMERVAQDFTSAFYTLPPGLFDALIQCATKALSLQERYSLVYACTFLCALINRTCVIDELSAQKVMLFNNHGRALMQAILEGFAGVAPRSAVQNLIEILGVLLVRVPPGGGVGQGIEGIRGGAAGWMREILLSESFYPSKAGLDAKEKFIKAVVGSRTLKKTREAAQQFTLVARGLEGSNFGYSSVTM
ncbi:hypothetical protein CVT24_002281, partial [Panaeolus cyanescens]